MTEQQGKDLAFLEAGVFPAVTICPVIRGDYPNREHGVVLYDAPVILLANLYHLPEMTEEQIDALKKIEYNSYREIVEDGWYVD